MIARVRMFNPDENRMEVFMFGNSYKSWKTQLHEFFWIKRFKNFEVEEISISRSRWIGWGGLKWCTEEVMQEQLNREGCQNGEPDNPKPRIYKNFKFKPFYGDYRT